MTESQITCAKCGGLMEAGWVPDFGHGSVFLPKWFRGVPEKSWWTGLRIPEHDPLNDPLYIRVFRYEACGFLEAYAKPEFGPS